MSPGKAFELFIRHLLNALGFSNVVSDSIYIFDGSAGQMIQGLAEAHNADVLVEPPVQIPFNTPARLLVECKNFQGKIGLNTLRSALGLKEDVNNFDIVDFEELKNRRTTRRYGITYSYTRYYYQIAVASMNGFSIQAQKFALTHRISLIDFSRLPFWHKVFESFEKCLVGTTSEEMDILKYAEKVSKNMAIAVLNSGQLLFLYNEKEDDEVEFKDFFTLSWESPESLWRLTSGDKSYVFALPDLIRDKWLDDSIKDSIKENAILCKESFFSNMVVYYSKEFRSKIKMISIDKQTIKNAKNR